MHERRHSSHTAAAAHWNDVGSIYQDSTYPSPTSHVQTHPRSFHYSITQGAQQNTAHSVSASRTPYSNISDQYLPEHSNLTTSDYTSYSPAASTMSATPNGGFHERRGTSPPATEMYRDALPESPTLASAFPPHNTSQSYSQPRWHSNPRAQYNPAPHGAPVLTQSYPAQIPFSQNLSSQYPASPPRPYACDLCALSFNRQHDLKRHRETHSGEKPYLCNGGCGKTFTRKDALKRHQLVKGCGKVDETWS